ncbi:hypothetical protein IAT40_005431 [Kwoniella sp. CBS 6097]
MSSSSTAGSFGDTPVSVLIIGCGPAGLINARTLLDDGFRVTIVAKEDGIGGCWRHTYPELNTNSPWGAFTFSGLDMSKPSNLDGSVVPARAYKRYLEDFYHYFVDEKAEVCFETEVISLLPSDITARGWTATLCAKGETLQSRHFDRVVLATGGLGEPFIPDVLRSNDLPIFHTSSLAAPVELSKLLDTIPSVSPETQPTIGGDEDTVVVIGGGKSSMDFAALLVNRGKKVVWACRGPMKWFAPSVPPGMFGANQLDIMFGPSRHIDSWTMWFYHCTWPGSILIKKFWQMIRGAWLSCYAEPLPKPTTDPYLHLANFAGGLTFSPTDFMSHVTSGKIAVLANAAPVSVDSQRISFDVCGTKTKVSCGAVIAATGYKGDTYKFIEASTRKALGLDREPPSTDSRKNVMAMQKKWRTIDVNVEELTEVNLPLVFRGILPLGRFRQRDLAVTGGTKPLAIPAISYEVESHWISSLFQDDPFLRLPGTEAQCLEAIHADNDFIRARYPGVNPFIATPSLTYFTGFSDVSYSRVLLRDMSLDPWRQKHNAQGAWWKFWQGGWTKVPASAEQYATLGVERKALRLKNRKRR